MKEQIKPTYTKEQELELIQNGVILMPPDVTDEELARIREEIRAFFSSPRRIEPKREP